MEISYFAIPGIKSKIGTLKTEAEKAKHIIEVVLDYKKMSKADFKKTNGTRRITDVKRMCAWLIRRKTTASLVRISRYINNTSDHAAIKYYLTTFQNHIETEEKTKKEVNQLLKLL